MIIFEFFFVGDEKEDRTILAGAIGVFYSNKFEFFYQKHPHDFGLSSFAF